MMRRGAWCAIRLLAFATAMPGLVGCDLFSAWAPTTTFAGRAQGSLADPFAVERAFEGPDFDKVAEWRLEPAEADVFVPNGSVVFKIVAKDASGKVLDQGANFFVPATDYPKVQLSGTTKAVRFVAGKGEGTYRVVASIGKFKAEALVRTHPMTPGDVRQIMGLRPAVADPADNPRNDAKVALGKRLFFETGLSRTGKMSCATCHDPGKGWTDHLPRAIGNDGHSVDRNAPTILDAASLAGPYLWDGRAPRLEDQVLAVFAASKEFDQSEDAAVAFLKQANYGADFLAAFGTAGISLDRVAKAIAAFERTVVTGDSPVDKFMAGDEAALSPDARRGIGVFAGPGKCIACHKGPMLTDESYHRTFVEENDDCGGSQGRKAITGTADDMAKYRTPPLRNVAMTGPYFHNGRALSLEAVVAHYVKTPVGDPETGEIGPFSVGRGVKAHTVDSKPGATPMPAPPTPSGPFGPNRCFDASSLSSYGGTKGVPMSPQEQADVVVFLKGLTGSPPPITAPATP
jgi:cytochrome c peroxidase